MNHVLCIYTQMFSVSHIQVVVPVEPKTVEIIQLVRAGSVTCLVVISALSGRSI